MKKSLITLLALALSCLMIFAACGNKADSDDADKDNDEETTVASEVTTDENGESFTPNEGIEVPLPSTPAEVETTAAPVVDTTAAPVIDVPEVTAPVVTEPTGSEEVIGKSYVAGSEEEGEMVLITLVSDANGNVAGMFYGMVADSSISTSVDLEGSFETVKASFETLESYGCNVTYDYTVEGTLYSFEAELIVEGEYEALFLAGMFGAENNGSIVKAADVESALLASGFEPYTDM